MVQIENGGVLFIHNENRNIPLPESNPDYLLAIDGLSKVQGAIHELQYDWKPVGDDFKPALLVTGISLNTLFRIPLFVFGHEDRINSGAVRVKPNAKIWSMPQIIGAGNLMMAETPLVPALVKVGRGKEVRDPNYIALEIKQYIPDKGQVSRRRLLTINPDGKVSDRSSFDLSPVNYLVMFEPGMIGYIDRESCDYAWGGIVVVK